MIARAAECATISSSTADRAWRAARRRSGTSRRRSSARDGRGRQLLQEVRGALARGQSWQARAPRRQHHVEAAQVVHREGSEREAELHQHAIDLGRGGALLQQEQRLARAPRRACGWPRNPRRHPTRTATLPSRLPSFMSVAITSGAVVGSAHELEQAHRLRGIEEMHAGDIGGALWRRAPARSGPGTRCCSRGWRRACTPGRAGEDCLLRGQVLGDRLDHEVNGGKICVAAGHSDEREAAGWHQPAQGCRGPRVPRRRCRLALRTAARMPRSCVRAPLPGCRRSQGTWRCRDPSTLCR